MPLMMNIPRGKSSFLNVLIIDKISMEINEYIMQDEEGFNKTLIDPIKQWF